MRVLAIDTALAACSAAVLDTEYGGIVASESLPMVRGHAEALMPLIAAGDGRSGMAFPRSRPHRGDHRTPAAYRLARRIAAARGLRSRRQAGRRPSTLSVYAAPHLGETTTLPGRRRHRCAARARLSSSFSPGGRTLTAPALRPQRSCARRSRSAACIVGSAALRSPTHLSEARAHRSPSIRGRARYRLGRPDGRLVPEDSRRRAAISARARRAAATCSAIATPMMNFVARLFSRAEPDYREAGKQMPRRSPRCTPHRCVAAGARMIRRLLLDRRSWRHRVMIGRTLDRLHSVPPGRGEAEILRSPSRRSGAGAASARPLLDLHLRRLAGLGVRRFFSRWTSTTHPQPGFIGRPDFTRSASAKAIMTAVRQPSCFGATSADAPSANTL